MNQQFVRYGPEVEQDEPDFDKTLQQILDDMKQHMRSSIKTEGVGLMVRNGGSVALQEIVDMAALGRIKSLVDRYPLSAVKQAYDDFKQGHLVGRAVLLPEAAAARASVIGTSSL